MEHRVATTPSDSNCGFRCKWILQIRVAKWAPNALLLVHSWTEKWIPAFTECITVRQWFPKWTVPPLTASPGGGEKKWAGIEWQWHSWTITYTTHTTHTLTLKYILPLLYTVSYFDNNYYGKYKDIHIWYVILAPRKSSQSLTINWWEITIAPINLWAFGLCFGTQGRGGDILKCLRSTAVKWSALAWFWTHFDDSINRDVSRLVTPSIFQRYGCYSFFT